MAMFSTDISQKGVVAYSESVRGFVAAGYRAYTAVTVPAYGATRAG